MYQMASILKKTRCLFKGILAVVAILILLETFNIVSRNKPSSSVTNIRNLIYSGGDSKQIKTDPVHYSNHLNNQQKPYPIAQQSNVSKGENKWSLIRKLEAYLFRYRSETETRDTGSPSGRSDGVHFANGSMKDTSNPFKWKSKPYADQLNSQDVQPKIEKTGLWSTQDSSKLKQDKNNSLEQYKCRHNRTYRKPSCVKLISGDESEQSYAYQFTRMCLKDKLANEDYINLTSNCEEYRRTQQYFMNISNEEREFPLAFSIVMYKDINQVEQLLKAVYRPHNYYCVHVDRKADLSIHNAMNSIIKCLPNVEPASRNVHVKWGKFSVLEAELVCMQDLLRYKKWKYFINLTGQEYPLKTNLQIVKILKIFNGANSVDTDKDRSVWRLRWRRAGKAPHGIKPKKGNTHVAVNREFINYAINNPVSKDFIKWLETTIVPDETFFPSLNHNPQLNISGTYTGNDEMTNWKNKPYIARFKNWKTELSRNPYFHFPCRGKWVRGICIFGIGDLPLLATRVELFANKFHWNYQPITLDCMQEWYRSEVQKELVQRMTINETYYRNIPYLQEVVKSLK